ncbi:sigma-54 dependent transcriptional regulator [Gilvimarinus sp. SDUM040013]|uniref:Sigma-54 dependent transcriptional regulator n=1 Tax=Gilvimarinus gilvus TaxID=3058038 RepID=A0ABU4RYZ3_9GAMM|nr:sigma-54 dependent transcriptional regulator [Gilvimarinus sp. SDUM040013]MDO3386642.1 sigma-54 dependent transcriptional regulator [Gilvimarinus sp. SDUM040013]MDX6849471.1 sigma-54 dependent transcriptional regulator [Gilvimarinus sp. SDUM040013]
MQHVLIIDDNPDVGKALGVLLKLHGVPSTSVLTPQAGLDALRGNGDVALVIQDMNFSVDTTSGDEGAALFRSLRAERPNIPIILLTAWTQLESAVSLIKAGAADYMAKPWDDHKLMASVSNLLELQGLRQRDALREQDRLARRTELASAADLCGLVYQSDRMHELASLAVKIAPTEVPVLITGANGAGKEKVANIIQRNSQRRHEPFVCVNVGALPADLMEAELFGAEPGAYTGSQKLRKGRFESADGGTLFLDELGNLSMEGQAKLLRVLQTGEFERLGSSQTQKVNVRIISATNADLKQAVREGRFREDLLYRLNVIELQVPELSIRRDDIPLLAQHFLGEDVELSPEILGSLQAYHWPGNIRELENACKRAAILSEPGKLQWQDFALDVAVAAEGESVPSIEPSKAMIEQALTINQGVIARAARQLGLSRQALYRRMEQYGIEN